MAANVTRSQPAAAGSKEPRAVLAQEPGVRRGQASAPGSSAESARKASGYGLPCSKCRLYYPADLDVCPTCCHNERVAPVAPKLPPKVAPADAAPVPDNSAVEKERDEFLRQFKSQLLDVHSEVANTVESVCKLAEHRAVESANAEICRPCYERLQERLDICEAALHLDLKEAGQIIYDAVWADPSDPSKTYQNAANALLIELRKRAGVTTVLGPFQPLSD